MHYTFSYLVRVLLAEVILHPQVVKLYRTYIMLSSGIL